MIEEDNNNNTLASNKNINNDITDVVPLILEFESKTKPATMLTKKPTNNTKSESTTNPTTISIIELANINNNTTTESNRNNNFKSKHKELVKVNEEL